MRHHVLDIKANPHFTTRRHIYDWMISGLLASCDWLAGNRWSEASVDRRLTLSFQHSAAGVKLLTHRLWRH